MWAKSVGPKRPLSWNYVQKDLITDVKVTINIIIYLWLHVFSLVKRSVQFSDDILMYWCTPRFFTRKRVPLLTKRGFWKRQKRTKQRNGLLLSKRFEYKLSYHFIWYKEKTKIFDTGFEIIFKNLHLEHACASFDFTRVTQIMDKNVFTRVVYLQLF